MTVRSRDDTEKKDKETKCTGDRTELPEDKTTSAVIENKKEVESKVEL